MFMAKCLDCPEPQTPWEFSEYEKRAAWVGQHRVQTGHRVHMWIQAPEER